MSTGGQGSPKSPRDGAKLQLLSAQVDLKKSISSVGVRGSVLLVGRCGLKPLLLNEDGIDVLSRLAAYAEREVISVTKLNFVTICEVDIGKLKLVEERLVATTLVVPRDESCRRPEDGVVTQSRGNDELEDWTLHMLASSHDA